MIYLDVMKTLEELGTDQCKNIYLNHGADIDLFGVSVSKLRNVAKQIKKNHDLGVQLLFSNNVDAIYLSQWIIDPTKLKLSDYEKIINSTNYYMIIENVVAPLVARNRQLSVECLHKWLDSNNSRYRQVAYTLFSLILGSFENELIDMDFVLKRLIYVEKNIQNEENRVRYTMNNFIISVGISLPYFTKAAIQSSINYGKVLVDMGNTSCRVPIAHEYIKKAEKMNKTGIKRKL